MRFLQSCPSEMKDCASGTESGLENLGMKKGRPEIERPKSREETPKWANGDLDRPTPPRYRYMTLFGLTIN